MAQAQIYDEQGNLLNPEATEPAAPTSFWNPDPNTQLPILSNTDPTVEFQGQTVPNVTGQTATSDGGTTPSPAPSTGTPQVALPEFGMGDMNIPPPPTFDQPDDASLTQPASNGLSADDQNMRSQASSIFGSDPGTPGGKYSGGYGRKANPLRDTDIGKRFAGASKAGTAYGNAFDKEGLLGGGKNATLAGGDDAELGSQPSDLLLQMLQLLGQG